MPVWRGLPPSGLQPLVAAACVFVLVACASDGPAHCGMLAAPPSHDCVTRPPARLEGEMGQGICSCSYCTRGRARKFNARSSCDRRQ
eukprot:9184086-Alexandrium_andersonii.AAC.1